MPPAKIHTTKPPGYEWSRKSIFKSAHDLSSARQALNMHKDDIKYKREDWTDAVIVKVGATKGKDRVNQPYRIAIKRR